jgi:hypothetical protein
MTPQTHVLIDAAQSVAPAAMEFEGSAHGKRWRVRLRTCHGGRSEGVQVVEIDNGSMTIDVLPTRGLGIWRVRRGEKTLGWRAPATEPVHPGFVQLMEPGGLGWLDGFNELLCRCGLESNGPPEFDDKGRLLRPLHGRISNTPAHYVALAIDEDAEVLSLRGIADDSRFHFQSLRLTTSISTRLGSYEFTWTDEVENVGGRSALMQMLYHFNIGHPLLQAGARITAPIRTAAPLTDIAAQEGIDNWNIMPPPRPESAEQVYVVDLAEDNSGNTRVLVEGLTDDEAVGLRFQKTALPCFTVWRNTPAEADGYVLGIEPGTNFPNPRSFEKQHGRVVSLLPGEKWQASITSTWHNEPRSIAAEVDAIKAIQNNCDLTLSKIPRQDWSAGA